MGSDGFHQYSYDWESQLTNEYSCQSLNLLVIVCYRKRSCWNSLYTLELENFWWMHIWPLNCFLMINKTQSNKINSWKWTFFFYTHNLFLLLRRLRTIEQRNFGYCGTYLYKPEQKEIKFLASWLALTLGMI